MKQLIVLLLLLSFLPDCTVGQTGLIQATKNSLIINNANTQHYMTIKVYRKGRLLASQLVAPNGNFQVSNLKIPTLGSTRSYSIESVYDDSAYDMDLNLHLQRINNAQYMRDEGAMRGCISKMERDAIWRSIITGLGGGKLVTIYDGIKMFNGTSESISIKRLRQDAKLIFGDGEKVDRKIDWMKKQFINVLTTDPFEYCPSLESDIRAYDRTYNALLSDRSIQDFAQTNLNKTQSNVTLRQLLNKDTKSVFMQTLPGIIIDADFYQLRANENNNESIQGKELNLSLALTRTALLKNGYSLRLYLTLGGGDSKLSLLPKNNYTSLTLSNNAGGLQNFIVASDKNTAINFYNEYAKAGLKTLLTRGALIFSFEGGVNSIYKNRVEVKADKYFTNMNYTLVQTSDFFPADKPVSLYRNRELGAYWKAGMKLSLLHLNKKLPANRMSVTFGISVAGADFSTAMIPDTRIETIKSSNNQITEQSTVNLIKMPLTIGAQAGFNF